ncbi:hypothetical protein [Candidatus Pyrohabitans sp.]
MQLREVEKLVKQLDPRRVGLITKEERREYYESVVKDDPDAQRYGMKGSLKPYLRRDITVFHIFLTRALGRDAVAPSEFTAMRRAEKGDVGSHLPTYKMISAFMDWMRHTCKKCGAWLEGEPRDEPDGRLHCECGGETYAPNTRNSMAQRVRGYLRNTAGTAPFGKGDNFWEWGENVTRKRKVSIEDIRRLEQAGNLFQRVLLGGWLCTGMSGDLIKLVATEELLEQLNQEPLPETVIFPWFRSKTRGREQRSQRKRYVGYVGVWVQHLAAWVKKKNIKPGDPLFPGHNHRFVTQSATQKAWKDLKKKAGIKENGEQFSPHVLRGYCFSTFVSVKDHETARYITGKKVDKSIVVYYNSHLFEPGPDGEPSLADIYRRAKRYLDPYAAMEQEAEKLRRQQESIEEKIARLEAESRAKDNIILQMREEFMKLKKQLTANPAQALQEVAEVQELRHIVEKQQEQIKQLQTLVLQLTNGAQTATAEG